VFEWLVDHYGTFTSPWTDCAAFTATDPNRVLPGGGYRSSTTPLRRVVEPHQHLLHRDLPRRLRGRRLVRALAVSPARRAVSRFEARAPRSDPNKAGGGVQSQEIVRIARHDCLFRAPCTNHDVRVGDSLVRLAPSKMPTLVAYGVGCLRHEPLLRRAAARGPDRGARGEGVDLLRARGSKALDVSESRTIARVRSGARPDSDRAMADVGHAGGVGDAFRRSAALSRSLAQSRCRAVSWRCPHPLDVRLSPFARHVAFRLALVRRE